MDTQFLNTGTNNLVFSIQWKYSDTVNNKKNIQYSMHRQTASANLKLNIRCIVLL